MAEEEKRGEIDIDRKEYLASKECAQHFNEPSHWEDLTDSFRTYYETIPKGEYKGDSRLNLAKVLHSTEMFNPFMDGGDRLKDNYSSEELFYAKKVKELKDFTGEDVTDLFDGILLLEMLYRHGKMWCHTLQCCDYINLISKMDTPCIGRTLVLGALKTCELFYEAISKIGADDEEFDPTKPNFPKYTPEDILGLLRQGLESEADENVKVRIAFRIELLNNALQLSKDTAVELPQFPELVSRDPKRYIRPDLYLRNTVFIQNIRRYPIPDFEEVKKIYVTDKENLAEAIKVGKNEKLLIPFCGLYQVYEVSDDILPRCAIRGYLFANLKGKMKSCMKQIGLPPHRLDVDEGFYNRLELVWTDTLKMMTHNKAHFFRNLPLLLEVYEMTHGDAFVCDRATLDKYPAPNFVPRFITPGHYINSYLVQIKFFLMTKFLMSGVRLELYSEHEYHVIYWYMSVLFAMMGEHYSEFRVQLDMDRRLYAFNNNKKKNVKKQNLINTTDQNILALYRAVSSGVSRFLLALVKIGLIKSPTLLLGTERMRYDLRFAGFNKVKTPAFIPFDKFEEQIENVQPKVLVVEAFNEFKKCKDLVDVIKNEDTKKVYSNEKVISSLYQVAMSNMLCAMRVIKTEKFDNCSVTLSFEQNKYFPVISMKAL
ncbi:hypothetical protein EIN_397790 [Entamoeba invadens IP1]|uniref:NAA35-like TPR repeats domain-containing protein n=1 Tax=Entamoeba invadens IP1 TaxID=370355 RepID=A0A0A1UFR9_ENTIV|nr:hypothetical protein EIN_397790 [Entamoeba invadens IP1]ELP91869.1 hypothetical protein EIN_397790 [Entamoeba invadens IP1]|eukprot:XP_004258640.1 hypothetical protein EIN_397790 [Entamoeba invadens IP1]